MSPRPRRKSAASHHVEWLQLVDISGPFLSLSVLSEVFPQGLDGVDPQIAESLRTAYSEWTANRELRHPDVALHTAFLRFVLMEILEYPSEFIANTQELGDGFVAPLPEHGVSLRPDLAVRRPSEPPKLLVSTYPAEVALQKPYDDRRFHASPAERMRLLLRQTGVRSGLVTNGGEWLLVHVPADRTATFVTWYTSLLVEERVTLRALRSLLGARRLFGVDDPETLDGLFERSRDDEREVTDQLGLQTRRAVELFVSAFDRADRDTGGELLKDVPEYRLYEAALAVVMRIIFLLAAEARGLFPDEGPWADSYAITPLRAQLEELADRGTLEALDRRFDAWPRLLAAFRAIHDGVRHSRVRMPGYGGGLFDPMRYPFLEGADEIVPRISNRAVLHILDALQTLEVNVSGGRERRPLSFRALGVEQIGHVYEGLLDHTAIRAAAPALGLTGTAKKEPEIPLAELEAQRIRGEQALLDFLVEQTGRSRSALKKGLDAVADPFRVAHLGVACDHDEALVNGVLPFLGLVRDDIFGLPMVFGTGAIYVTESPGRRATGTHYTPPSLTEPIVQYALEPVVYRGPTEDKPREEWELKRPSELLQLKVADIAVGSAAFLVAACRYLATRLVESWAQFPEEVPTDAGAELEERELTARRLVAERCLYGVDVNPLAVEIARVSVWLTTLRRDRPFTFLDHALRCGDSLLGLTSCDQFETLSVRPDEADSILLAPVSAAIQATLDEACKVRERIEASDTVDLCGAEEKAAALARADKRSRRLRLVGDLMIGAMLEEAAGKGRARTTIEAAAQEICEALRETDDDRCGALLARVEARAIDALVTGCAPGASAPPKPFHWVLEFPEVFERQDPGFDAVVGNPPFLGAARVTEVLGETYSVLLSRLFPPPSRRVDISARFVRRGSVLLRSKGCAGLLATNTLSQGETRRGGLDVLIGSRDLYRSIKSFSWPGEASVIAAAIWFFNGKWNGGRVCDGASCSYIGSLLEAEEGPTAKPKRLSINSERCFQGPTVWGEGFLLTPEEAQRLIDADERNADVVRPFMGGRELNTSISLAPERWIVAMGERSLAEASSYAAPFSLLDNRVRAWRESLDERRYGRVVRNWWKFFHARGDLFGGIEAFRLKRVLARSRVSDHHMVAFLPPDLMYSDALVVFLFDSSGHFAVIQSTIHEAWARKFASTLKTDMRYVPGDCFYTFPLPDDVGSLNHIGDLYLCHRAATLLAGNQGLTKTYNRVLEQPEDSSESIEGLRRLHRELDRAVADAYGWTDLELHYDFRETPLGLRYTISEAAKTEALNRLLDLNHRRYAEEVAQGLHATTKRRGSGLHKPAEDAQRLFET